MLKRITYLLLVIIAISSCKKEEPVTVVDTNPSNSGCGIKHWAWYKGIITDSITGMPVTGYTIANNYVCGPSDTIIDGTYKLHTCWYESYSCAPRPEEVVIYLFDSIWNYHTLGFDGNLLMEDDTITINFEVNL